MYDHLSINSYAPIEEPSMKNNHTRRNFDHGIEKSELLARELSSPIEPGESWSCWLYLSQLCSSTKIRAKESHHLLLGQGPQRLVICWKNGQARVPVVEKRICLFPIYSSES